MLCPKAEFFVLGKPVLHGERPDLDVSSPAAAVTV